MTSTRAHPVRSGEMYEAEKADWRTRTSSATHGVTRVLWILALVGAACSPSSTPATAPGEGSADTGPDAPRTYALGSSPQSRQPKPSRLPSMRPSRMARSSASPPR